MDLLTPAFHTIWLAFTHSRIWLEKNTSHPCWLVWVWEPSCCLHAISSYELSAFIPLCFIPFPLLSSWTFAEQQQLSPMLPHTHMLATVPLWYESTFLNTDPICYTWNVMHHAQLFPLPSALPACHCCTHYWISIILLFLPCSLSPQTMAGQQWSQCGHWFVALLTQPIAF